MRVSETPEQIEDRLQPMSPMEQQKIVFETPEPERSMTPANQPWSAKKTNYDTPKEKAARCKDEGSSRSRNGWRGLLA